MTLPFTDGHANPLREEIRRTVRLAAPVAATQLGMMAMGLVDTIMVGPLGAESLAAVSVGNSVFFALLILCMGMLQALEPLVAQALGAGETEGAGRHLWQGAWLGVVLAVPATALFVDSQWMFDGLRQPAEVSVLAGEYLGGRTWAVFPFLVFTACRSFLNGVGDTRPVMVIALWSNLVNLGADWVLIYGRLGMPALGVAGAGLATAVVRWVMLAAVLWVLLRQRYRQYRVHPQAPVAREVLGIARIGLPIGGQLLLEVGLFASVSVLAGWLGARAQAAHQIALSLASFTFMVPLGVSIAATVRVGYEVGRGDLDGAARAGRVALALGGAVMVAAAAAFLLLPGPLARIFSPEPDVFATAVTLVGIAAIFQVFDGVQIVATGCLRGAGDTRTPFLANAVSHWLVGVPLAWTLAFPLGWGVSGLWWGLTISLMLVSVLETGLFLRGGWRRRGRLNVGSIEERATR